MIFDIGDVLALNFVQYTCTLTPSALKGKQGWCSCFYMINVTYMNVTVCRIIQSVSDAAAAAAKSLVSIFKIK